MRALTGWGRLENDGSMPHVPLTSHQVDELLRAARQAQRMAHNPYSGVEVGAALLCSDGRVFVGCNVENASFGLTLCAERVAVVRAVSEGVKDLAGIAICSNRPTPTMPCGACRQFLHEFAADMPVIVQGKGEQRVESSLARLLPQSFGPGDL